MLFSCRSDFEIITESRVISAQYTASVTIISQRLSVAMREIKEFNNQILNMSQKLAKK